MTELEINYTANPTISLFHHSDAPVRGVRGPRGSGKSSGMCAEIFRRSKQQRKGREGKRRSRWGIVRNTYRELEDTTLKTWLDWWDEAYFGRFNHRTMTHLMQFDDVHAEVVFRALDRPKDVKKLLSLELTGAWLNEAREMPFGFIGPLRDAIGRYPATKDGGVTWCGLMMDTNSMDTDHWWYAMSEKDPEALALYGIELESIGDSWQFWSQPGGLLEVKDGVFKPNPHAENTENLNEGVDYYTERAKGASKQHIRIYYCNKYGFISDGMPVLPEYNDTIHYNDKIQGPLKGLPIGIGLDFGLTPAAIFAQRLPLGRIIWFDELVTEHMGAVNFSKILKPKLSGEYQDFEVEIWGDPAGDHEAQTNEETVFQILKANGIDAKPAPVRNNDFTIRREAIAQPLSRLIDAKPGLQIGPKCVRARKGLAGGYCYKRVQMAGVERYHNKPDKNKYSHVVEAGGYVMVGFGEGLTIIKKPGPKKPRQTHAITDYNEFD